MSLTRYNWLVDGQPTQNRYTILGDVTGSIEVSMEFKPTFTTEKRGTLTITFVNMAANRTLLRSVSSIDGNNLLTKILGLIPDKLFQFVERPVVEFPIELSTSTFLNTDLRQVFKCEYREWSLNNLLRDAVVNISHKPSFSTRQLPEFADAGTSAFGLEFGSEMGVITTCILHSPGIKKRVIRTDCNVDNTPINSKNSLFRDYLRGIGFKLAVQIKRIAALTKRQGRRFDLPRQVWPVVFRNTERGFNPAVRCGDSRISRSQKHVDNTGIVSHCRILLTERFELAFNRFQSFTSNISRALYQRGREIRNRLSNIVIGSIVAVDLADRMGFKTPFGTGVERHSIISHGFQERLSAIRRNVKFQLDCPNHSHILVVIDNILNGGEWCGAIPPTAKAVGFLAPRS